MREIKFRGKRLDNNKWVYGGYLKHQKVMPCPIGHVEKDTDYQSLIIQDGFADWNMPRNIVCFEVDATTVGQFTGLKDKNGVEIYESDIVKIVYSDNGDECSEIIAVKDSGKGMGYSPLNWEQSCDGCDCCLEIISVEVLGNEFENPDLLGAE